MTPNPWRSYVRIPEFLQNAKITAYFDAIETEFISQDKDWDLRQWFFDTIIWWWDGRIETSDLIHWMSFTLLPSNPSLFQDLSILLESRSERVVVSTSDDDQVVEYAILLSSHDAEARAQIISISTFAKNAACVIRDTRIVRQILEAVEPLSYFLDIDTFWAPGVMELLQFELDNPTTKGIYRRNCIKCIRELEKKYHVLPPSLFLKYIIRDGPDALNGGGFADIWRGELDGQIVCIKVPRMFTSSNQETKETTAFAFRHEALLWRQLNHPNVLPFLGVNVNLFTPARLSLVSPWMENGNIIQYLTNHSGHDLLSSISEIATGLDYLHSLSPPIVHGDIRGANILVTPDIKCCLADFGLSLAAETSQIFTTTSDGMKGCIRWLAPECITPSKLQVSKSERDDRKKYRDIYAFGCTIIEIITLKPPFSNRPVDATVILDVIRGTRPERPQGPDIWCPDNIWDLTERCWDQDPHKRPHADEVKSFLHYLQRESGEKKKVKLGEHYLYSYSQPSSESLVPESIWIDVDMEERSTWTVLDDSASGLLPVLGDRDAGAIGYNEGGMPSVGAPPGNLSSREGAHLDSVMETAEVTECLKRRVKDWKGHSIESFGPFLLRGIFDLTEGVLETRCQVFLFERILLCFEDFNLLSPLSDSSSELTPLCWTLRRAIYLLDIGFVEVDKDQLFISLQDSDHAGLLALRCVTSAQQDLWQSTITSLTSGDLVSRFIRDAHLVGNEADESREVSCSLSELVKVPVPSSRLRLGRDESCIDEAGRLTPASVLESIMDLPDLELDTSPLSAVNTDASSMWSDRWQADVDIVDHDYDTSFISTAKNHLGEDDSGSKYYTPTLLSEFKAPEYRPTKHGRQRSVKFRARAQGQGLHANDGVTTTSRHSRSSSLASSWEPWDKESERWMPEISVPGLVETFMNKTWRIKR
ncbi:hypothetical protein VKT23_001510 [Stygiomarasmius scandens]|uniref:Protein kinase domain-containing protein n=1 Tax=Marasmiellus scandens TaxID=2682957 RepID=A0ABR1JZ23_9AGAR